MFEEYITSVFNNAKIIVSIDNQLLDNSLLNIFKNKNYLSFIVILEDIDEELFKIKKKISTINEASYIELDNYIEGLLSYSSTLSSIASKLNDKANSRHYSLSDYKFSLNELSSVKNTCQYLQEILLNSLPKIEGGDISFLYELASEELENKTFILSLWSKTFAEQGGDENKTIANYIKHRVEQLTNLIQTPQKNTGWMYYIGERWLYFDSYITNIFYERGNGEIRTIYDGEIIDVPFEEIITADGSLKYSASRVEGLVSIIKNKGLLMPSKNNECDSLLSNIVDAVYDSGIYWEDIGSIIFNNSKSEIVVSYNKNETIIKI